MELEALDMLLAQTLKTVVLEEKSWGEKRAAAAAAALLSASLQGLQALLGYM